ncbi:MAG: hypothetical protein ACI4F2_03570, partial [Acutalibacteraceae bacterium]
ILRSGMYLLNVYSVVKVLEVLSLDNQLGNFQGKIKRFSKNFFIVFSPPFGHKKSTHHFKTRSDECSKRKSPLISQRA